MSLEHRYDFVLLFDVQDGNPNGDPDAGNLPRLDDETGCGLVTDVCLKRKVRNYVTLSKGPKPPYEIFVKEKAILNLQIERAYSESPEVKGGLAAWQAWRNDKKNNPKPERAFEDLARDWMCHNFYDIRTFGAVMSTGDKQNAESGDSKIKMTAGQVRGPVQITFSRSIDPIMPQEHSLTVVAARTERKTIEEQIGIQGRKHTVPYGLYRAHGFVSAFLADQTGFSSLDLELFWEALANMFEHDRSAARGLMSTKGLYIFEHDSKLGNAPAHTLFARIAPKLRDGATAARSFGDYLVDVDEKNLPSGVKLLRRVG